MTYSFKWKDFLCENANVYAALRKKYNNEELPEHVLKFLSEHDPGGKHPDGTSKNTYLQWTALQVAEFANDVTTDGGQSVPEQVIETATLFHGNKNKLKGSKELRTYSYQQAREAISDIGSKRDEKKQKKLEGATKLYEDSDITVLKINTKEAACQYGAGTTWCTAAQGDNLFDSYNNNCDIFNVLLKNEKYTKSDVDYQNKFQVAVVRDTGVVAEWKDPEQKTCFTAKSLNKKYNTIFLKMYAAMKNYNTKMSELTPENLRGGASLLKYIPEPQLRQLEQDYDVRLIEIDNGYPIENTGCAFFDGNALEPHIESKRLEFIPLDQSADWVKFLREISDYFYDTLLKNYGYLFIDDHAGRPRGKSKFITKNMKNSNDWKESFHHIIAADWPNFIQKYSNSKVGRLEQIFPSNEDISTYGFVKSLVKVLCHNVRFGYDDYAGSTGHDFQASFSHDGVVNLQFSLSNDHKEKSWKIKGHHHREILGVRVDSVYVEATNALFVAFRINDDMTCQQIADVILYIKKQYSDKQTQLQEQNKQKVRIRLRI